MRTCARLVCAVTLAAMPAAAQSTTEDGIRAMLRGDYQAAARILKPLADDESRPDPVAQFFLAIMYDSGSGVSRDNGRACGLFTRAAASSNPFTEQASAIADRMRDELGSGASIVCVGQEHWGDGPPQAFDLEPGDRIVFASTSITLTHAGQEQRTPMVMPTGLMVMPIRYVPLDVRQPVAVRRHFFIWSGWMPDTTANTSSWSFGWALVEVAGGELFHHGGDQRLLVVQGAARPAPYDVTSFVKLRVNADGEAEVTVTAGESPRTAVVPWKGAR